MRLLGLLMFFAGIALAVRATRGALGERKARALGWALALPVGVVLVTLGLVLLLVPGFLGG